MPAAASGGVPPPRGIDFNDTHQLHVLTELGCFWSEQYLLRALLSRSDAFRVLFGCNYAFLKFPDEVSRALGLADGRAFGGGTSWFEVVK